METVKMQEKIAIISLYLILIGAICILLEFPLVIFGIGKIWIFGGMLGGWVTVFGGGCFVFGFALTLFYDPRIKEL